MGGSLKLSWIVLLVFMLRPLLNEMEVVQAAEVRKLYENRKFKEELLPACDEKECQIACENDGYWKGRCFSDACVCFVEAKKVEAEEAAEKRQVNYQETEKVEAKEAEKRQVTKKEDRELCTSDPPCIAACKKDGFCSGQCMTYSSCRLAAHDLILFNMDNASTKSPRILVLLLTIDKNMVEEVAAAKVCEYKLKGELMESEESCDDNKCKDFCKGRGFYSGICSGNNCFCLADCLRD
ncbi:hypothetical protein POM88_015385 [Heracleum sosnowskyi]|uniref:Uncharacterized protein n=1 Tax=Heracleum sosnowskyi TaxID=360622 RepID=A0AAD8IMS2_9APIA|nr:hypothetical protein POM88_015385 [Heracleum sosnowskyi]